MDREKGNGQRLTFDTESRTRRTRVCKCIARIVRAYGRSLRTLPEVFGIGTATSAALRSRVSALQAADGATVAHCAERLHTVAVWLAAVTEAIEENSAPAAALHADLAVIVAEAEKLLRCSEDAAGSVGSS